MSTLQLGTGPQVFRGPVLVASEKGNLGGYRSSGFAWTGPSMVSDLVLGEGTGLPKRRRPVPVKSET